MPVRAEQELLYVVDDTVIDEADFDIAGEIEVPGTFHFLKRAGRSLKEVFTFDTVKKAEVRLEHANIELLEAHKAFEVGDVTVGAKALARFETKLEKIKDDAFAIREKKQEGDSRADIFLDDVLDSQIKHKKLLGNIEEQVLFSSEDTLLFEEVKNAEERASTHALEVLSTVETNPVLLTERFDRVLAKQEGSPFKDFKNVEILDTLVESGSEDVEEAFLRAKNNAVRRVTAFLRDGGEDAALLFEQYTERVGGDEIRFLEILDQMKRTGDLSSDMVQQIEYLKDVSVVRLEEKFASYEAQFDEGFTQRAQARLFERFEEDPVRGVDFEALRVLDDMKHRFRDEALKEDILKHHDASIVAFSRTFTDDVSQEQIAQFTALTKQMADTPDPATFRILEEAARALEDEVRQDPEKAAWLDDMEKEVKQSFAKKFEDEGDVFLEKIASSNPQDIAVYKQLQQDFLVQPDTFFDDDVVSFGPVGSAPPGFARIFDRAIAKHTQGLQEHVALLEDPKEFDHFQQKLEDFDVLPLELRRFETQFKEKQAFFEAIDKEELEFYTASDEKRALLAEEFRVKFEDPDLTDDERIALEEAFQTEQRVLDEEDFTRRQEFFERRLAEDPFCDDACKEAEKRQFASQVEFERKQIVELEKFHAFEAEKERLRHEEAFDNALPGTKEEHFFDEHDTHTDVYIKDEVKDVFFDDVPPKPVYPKFDDAPEFFHEEFKDETVLDEQTFFPDDVFVQPDITEEEKHYLEKKKEEQEFLHTDIHEDNVFFDVPPPEYVDSPKEHDTEYHEERYYEEQKPFVEEFDDGVFDSKPPDADDFQIYDGEFFDKKDEAFIQALPSVRMIVDHVFEVFDMSNILSVMGSGFFGTASAMDELFIR